MEVIVSNYMCITQEFKQYRFPVSKKKRIRNKWTRKKSRNWRLTEVHRAIIVGNKMFVSQKIYDEMLKSIPKRETNNNFLYSLIQ